MDDTPKMLRAIINGQSAFRQEILSRLDKLETKLEGMINKVEKNLTERIDKLGMQLAYLEDDSPTREEFDKLEKRVDKIEQKATSTL